jgi:hypothetical protein
VAPDPAHDLADHPLLVVCGDDRQLAQLICVSGVHVEERGLAGWAAARLARRRGRGEPCTARCHQHQHGEDGDAPAGFWGARP